LSLHSRLFAALYDPFFQRAERAGLSDRRRALVAEARGRVLEIGAGTGLNLRHYPETVEELVLTEPEDAMARKLEGKLRDLSRRGRVVRASAERLPFDDDSFDTAVATFVLCTVDHPEQVLNELQRVLRPGGRFLFLEHVRADSPGLARWQDRLHGPWLLFGNGCHCNRPTPATFEASGLAVERMDRDHLDGMPPLVQPIITGSAAALTPA